MIKSSSAEIAIAVVREAALLADQIQSELVSAALTKDDRSPVTVADFAAQALVAHRLAEHFSNDALIGEESADALRADGGQESLVEITRFVRRSIPSATNQDVLEWVDRGAGQPPASFWTLDPVDGTKGFLRGEQYAIALAKVTEGKVEIAALGCPQLDEICTGSAGRGTVLVAVRGQGTWAAPLADSDYWEQLAVSRRQEVAEARFLRSVESAHTDTGAIGDLVSNLEVRADPVGMDSQAKYAVLAAGHGEVLLRLLSPSRPDYREKIWDQAAGSLVIEEAGGRVTDLDGQPLDFSCGRTLAQNRGILATNGLLHEVLLAGLRRIGA